MATIIVFENDEERTALCASPSHNFDAQPEIFGMATKRVLKTCDKLFHASLECNIKEIKKQQRKLYSLAKSHGVYIRWFGEGRKYSEPDFFLVAGHGYDRLAFIQC